MCVPFFYELLLFKFAAFNVTHVNLLPRRFLLGSFTLKVLQPLIKSTAFNVKHFQEVLCWKTETQTADESERPKHKPFMTSSNWFGLMVVAILLFGARNDQRFDNAGAREDILTPQCIPSFIVYFTLNQTIIYKVNILLCWRRLEPNDWHHECIWKLFAEVINQARSRVIFS